MILLMIIFQKMTLMNVEVKYLESDNKHAIIPKEVFEDIQEQCGIMLKWKFKEVTRNIVQKKKIA